ncbi:MAG: ABC transporter ATP-binding protein [Acholeplasmatales bacterium]|nr:ABC transporter ATP-binding protein [Acholeplasmatales bacterium]
MENIIEIKNLSKSYNDVKAVSDISFKVKKGEFFAFLGENGAGKSTTINIMCGLLSKDNGTVIIDSMNIDEKMNLIKNEIGVVFQSSVLDKELSVNDNLKYRAGLYNIHGADYKNRLSELSKLLDLDEILNRRVGKLSGGQKRRVDIARALIHNPKILILDEPTTGLDPQTRKIVWNVINNLRINEGLTVFLTTHYMEEVVDSDYVVILDKGNIVAEGTPLDLKNQYTNDSIIIYNCDEEEIKTLNLNYLKVKNYFKIEVSNTADATKLIINHPDLFKDYEIIKGKMDDVFLAVTGKNLPGGEA